MPQPGVSVRPDGPDREPERVRDAAARSRPRLTVLDGRSALDDMDLASRSAAPRRPRAVATRRAPERQPAPIRYEIASEPPALPEPPAPSEPRAGNGAASRPASGVPGRRTITITGRGAERYSSSTYGRRRPQRPVHERPGFQPDRFAMWAVLLGVLLLLVAATSSHAAMRSTHGGASTALVAHAHTR